MVWVLALYTEYGDKKILYIKQTKHRRLKLEKKVTQILHFISSSINLFFLMSAAAFIKLHFFSNFSPLYKETKQKQIFNHDMHFLHWYGFLFRKYPQISRKIS